MIKAHTTLGTSTATYDLYNTYSTTTDTSSTVMTNASYAYLVYKQRWARGMYREQRPKRPAVEDVLGALYDDPGELP